MSTNLRSAPNQTEHLRIGLITDIHYADLTTAGTRHYRDSIAKVRNAVQAFNAADLDLVICLGDLIDTGKTVQEEAGHLDTIYREFKALKAPIHFVLGNHCVWTLTKSEFLKGVEQEKSFDAVVHKGVRLVMLDACYRKDGVSYGRKNYTWTDTDIPDAQRHWLEKTLSEKSMPTLVFVHQRLDVGGNYGVHSGPAVRRILESSEQVATVFQGHNHVNDHQTIQGIHYITLNAVIEGSSPQNNAYAVLDYHPTKQAIKLDGYWNQKDYQI